MVITNPHVQERTATFANPNVIYEDPHISHSRLWDITTRCAGGSGFVGIGHRTYHQTIQPMAVINIYTAKLRRLFLVVCLGADFKWVSDLVAQRGGFDPFLFDINIY